jgi:hypothetical protein
LNQAIHELGKFKDEYLSHPPNQETNNVRKTEITKFIILAIVDFLFLDLVAEKNKLVKLGFNKKDIEFKEGCFNKLIGFLKDIEEDILLGASDEILFILKLKILIDEPSQKKEAIKKAKDYLYEIRREAAYKLEQLLNKRLRLQEKGYKYLHIIDPEEGKRRKLDWMELPDEIRHSYVGCPKFGKTERGYWIKNVDRMTDFEFCSSCSKIRNKDSQDKLNKKAGQS